MEVIDLHPIPGRSSPAGGLRAAEPEVPQPDGRAGRGHGMPRA